MTRWGDLLRRGLDDLGVAIPSGAAPRLIAYLEILDRWNHSINLTSLEPVERIRRLVIEPLWVSHRLAPTGRYLDIGSGNGSPAIPWTVACDFESVELFEARQRRAVFLGVASRRLGLAGVRVHAARLGPGGPPEVPLFPPDWVTLQGVRLDGRLLGYIRGIGPRASVVWLTGGHSPPEPPAVRLRVPGTDRVALVFTPGRTSSGPA